MDEVIIKNRLNEMEQNCKSFLLFQATQTYATKEKAIEGCSKICDKATNKFPGVCFQFGRTIQENADNQWSLTLDNLNIIVSNKQKMLVKIEYALNNLIKKYPYKNTPSTDKYGLAYAMPIIEEGRLILANELGIKTIEVAEAINIRINYPNFEFKQSKSAERTERKHELLTTLKEYINTNHNELDIQVLGWFLEDVEKGRDMKSIELKDDVLNIYV